MRIVFFNKNVHGLKTNTATVCRTIWIDSFNFMLTLKKVFVFLSWLCVAHMVFFYSIYKPLSVYTETRQCLLKHSWDLCGNALSFLFRLMTVWSEAGVCVCVWGGLYRTLCCSAILDFLLQSCSFLQVHCWLLYCVPAGHTHTGVLS